MATLTTANQTGEREQLADIIYKIDSDETPIFSLAKKETVNGTLVQWSVQELASAGQNSLSEGADASYATPTATTILNNHTQISGKDFAISGTLESVDKAGRAKESAYQSVLKGLELRRDIEKIVGDLNVAKSGSEPRKSATLVTWMTNGDASPSDISFGTGDGSDVADLTGTEAALTLAKIDNAVTQAWNDGGKPRVLVCDASNKANISDLSQSGTNLVTNQVSTTASSAPAFVGSVSVYLTDYGTLDLTPSRFMSNDKLFIIDPDHIKIGTLNGRNFSKTQLAQTGDAIKEQIICEWVLMPTAPKAHSAVIGLSGA
jgi:hypothetical protein